MNSLSSHIHNNSISVEHGGINENSSGTQPKRRRIDIENTIQKVTEPCFWNKQNNKRIFEKYPKLADRYREPKSVRIQIMGNGRPSHIDARYAELRESEFFKSLFENNNPEMSENKTNTVKTPFSETVVDWVIGRLNDQVGPLSSKKKYHTNKEVKDNILDIYALLHLWGIPRLLKECREYLPYIAKENYGNFINIVKLFAVYEDEKGLKLVSDVHNGDLLMRITDLYDLMNKYNFKMPERMLDNLRNDIVEVIQQKGVTLAKLANIFQIAKDPRIGCNHVKVSTAFCKKLVMIIKGFNEQQFESRITRLKEKIKKYDMTFFLETVTLKFEKRLFRFTSRFRDNFLESFTVVCLFKEYIKKYIIVGLNEKSYFPYKNFEKHAFLILDLFFKNNISFTKIYGVEEGLKIFVFRVMFHYRKDKISFQEWAKVKAAIAILKLHESLPETLITLCQLMDSYFLLKNSKKDFSIESERIIDLDFVSNNIEKDFSTESERTVIHLLSSYINEGRYPVETLLNLKIKIPNLQKVYIYESFPREKMKFVQQIKAQFLNQDIQVYKVLFKMRNWLSEVKNWAYSKTNSK